MHDNLRGSLLMILAMAGFAVEDMFIKSAAATLPVGEILILFGAGGTLAFAALTLRRGEAILHPAVLSRALAFKAVFEVIGRLGYTLALALAPLSNTAAILQATPLVVVAGAALIFGERVGWRRWLAIAIGFAGVMVMLRPGAAGFTAGALFAVIGTLGFAGRDLATRAAPVALSNLQLGFWGFLMLVPTGAAILAVTGGAHLPDGAAARDVLLATLIGVCAYYALTSAMRVGEVSVVTPFRYTRLVFAVILGVTVFSERPDSATLLGSAIVIGSGLYTLMRQRRLSARRAG